MLKKFILKTESQDSKDEKMVVLFECNNIMRVCQYSKHPIMGEYWYSIIILNDYGGISNRIICSEMNLDEIGDYINSGKYHDNSRN